MLVIIKQISEIIVSIGTLVVGLIACWQNKKLRELNIYTCKINERMISLEEETKKSYIKISNIKLIDLNEGKQLVIEFINTTNIPIVSILPIKEFVNILGIITEPDRDEYIRDFKMNIYKENRNEIFTLDITLDSKIYYNDILSFKIEIENLHGYITEQICNVRIMYFGIETYKTQVFVSKLSIERNVREYINID